MQKSSVDQHFKMNKVFSFVFIDILRLIPLGCKLHLRWPLYANNIKYNFFFSKFIADRILYFYYTFILWYDFTFWSVIRNCRSIFGKIILEKYIHTQKMNDIHFYNRKKDDFKNAFKYLLNYKWMNVRVNVLITFEMRMGNSLSFSMKTYRSAVIQTEMCKLRWYFHIINRLCRLNFE